MTERNKFDNISNEQLADLIGVEDAHVKWAGAQVDEMKDEAKRRGIETASGEKFTITVARGERTVVDMKLLRAAMPNTIALYDRTTPTSTLRITPLFQQDSRP